MNQTPPDAEGFDPFEDALKVLTVFDWIDPLYDVGLMLLGDEPVHVPHLFRYEATEVLGVRPHTFDVLHDAWVYMVDDAVAAGRALEAAGIPLAYGGDDD